LRTSTTAIQPTPSDAIVSRVGVATHHAASATARYRALKDSTYPVRNQRRIRAGRSGQWNSGE
jgi:hypothetical protein